MNEDQSLKDTLKQVHQGRGRRTAYLVGAVAAVGILIAALVSMTRGTDIEGSSAAMVEAMPEPVARQQDAGPQR